ncbi:MAG: RNA polymerase sigma-70 factor [Bacteroidales bacterium]
MKKEDSEIKSLFESDEEKAFKLIFDRYYSNLSTIAFLYIHDITEAEEVVQQLFIKLWEGKHYKNINSSLNSYLNTGVRNACLNYLEKRKTERNRLLKIPEQETTTQSLDFLMNDEKRLVFEKAISELPKQCRKAIELVYFSNRSYKEAAENLNVSINSIKTHLKTALRKLRGNKELNQYFQEKR